MSIFIIFNCEQVAGMTYDQLRIFPSTPFPNMLLLLLLPPGCSLWVMGFFCDNQ